MMGAMMGVMTLNTALAATITVLVGVALLGAPPAASVDTTPQGVVHASGTVRCADGQWAPIADAGHEPFGIQKVEALSDRVRVWYAEPMTQVRVGLVQVDDTYTRDGYAAGASVGLSYTDLWFARYGKPVGTSPLCLKGSNVWLEIRSAG